MPVIYPTNCNTPGERVAWCGRADEKLRLVHNGMGEWYKVGFTQNQYDKLPNRIRNKYSYTAKLSESNWQDFKDNMFLPLLKKILHAQTLELEKAKIDDTTWEPDLDTDIS